MSDLQTNLTPQNGQEPGMRLDDEARVKVLSPTMLVIKRFMRNRLAITGLCILIVMFIFSFLGGIISPYSQTQVFYKYDIQQKEYAGVAINDELRYTVRDDESFSMGARSQFILAKNKGSQTFTADGNTYSYRQQDENYYHILQNEELGTALDLRGSFAYSAASDRLTDEVIAAFEAAMVENDASFELDGELYTIAGTGKSLTISRSWDVAIASQNVYDTYRQGDTGIAAGYEFRRAAEDSIVSDAPSFTADGVEYTLEIDESNVTIYTKGGGEPEPFAIVSTYLVSAISPDVYITVSFKNAILDAIDEGQKSFFYTDENGETTEYFLTRTNTTYTVRREEMTQLIDTYASPTKEHWLGTDANGMDMLTRLMYGGRVSLMVGFIVVLIQLFIGVIFGGLSGYFGGWIDALLMRVADIVISLPDWPILIIAGSVMDSLDVSSNSRIFFLMMILGVMGWTGIARIVRGQILSLREQDFMVATEATGIRVSRRIFRHLVPNVMPLLIVQATMSLGSIIITEATLSFLGLGLKYPLASWGTIINNASDAYVMRNFWFNWIPAGVLILITVLGFNFVGDGLRDAFDPKMKR